MMLPDSARSDSPSSNDEQARQLMELADGLLERAQALASQADQMIFALDLAARRVLASGRGVETTPIVVPVRLLQGAPLPVESNQSAPSAAPTEDLKAGGAAANSDHSVSAGVRQLITRMALAGSGQEEIARRLREDFGFEDPDELIRRVGA